MRDLAFGILTIGGWGCPVLSALLEVSAAETGVALALSFQGFLRCSGCSSLMRTLQGILKKAVHASPRERNGNSLEKLSTEAA